MKDSIGDVPCARRWIPRRLATRTITLTACACSVASIDLPRVKLGVEVAEGEGGTSEAFDQRPRDGAELVVAAEVILDINDYLVEEIGGVCATVQLVTG